MSLLDILILESTSPLWPKRELLKVNKNGLGELSSWSANLLSLGYNPSFTSAENKLIPNIKVTARSVLCRRSSERSIGHNKACFRSWQAYIKVLVDSLNSPAEKSNTQGQYSKAASLANTNRLSTWGACCSGISIPLLDGVVVNVIETATLSVKNT